MASARGGKSTAPQKEKSTADSSREEKEQHGKSQPKLHRSHSHPLKFEIPQSYEKGAWRCDLCQKSGSGIAVWHCDACSYDVCDGCMNQSSSTQQQSRGLEAGAEQAVSVSSTASIAPSPAALEDIDPSRSSAGFLETFALSSNRVDALLLATPGSEDSYFFAGLAQLHASGSTGGNVEHWKLFLEKYRALFGQNARYEELLWRSRFGQYDAGMMSKNEQKEFLALIADEMHYGPERDKNGKIVDVNPHFRKWYQDDSVWQPKERRGLSQPPKPASPPTAARHSTQVDDVRIAADADPTIGEVPKYFNAFLKGESLAPWGEFSDNKLSISKLVHSADSAVFLGLNSDKVHPSLSKQALEYFTHPSQPNLYKFFVLALNHEWQLSEARVKDFQKLPEKDRHGRTLESVKEAEKSSRQSQFSEIFESKLLLFTRDDLVALWAHPVYGINALACESFVTAYLQKLVPNVDLGPWDTLQVAHKTAFYEAVYNFAVKADAQLPRQEFLNLKYCALLLWLNEERLVDTWNWERFAEFIRVPKDGSFNGWHNSQWRENELKKPNARVVELENHPWRGVAHLDELTVAPDKFFEDFVSRYFESHPADTDGSAFNAYLADGWLRSILARTRLLSGEAPAQWLAMLASSDVKAYLPADKVQALQERVDLELAPTNRKYFPDTEEPVTLSIYTKNIRQLLVKVFEVNTEAYYRTNYDDVSTDINLDGLAPNVEQMYKYDGVSALHRAVRTFQFPQLGNRRGVFVIEFVAQGRSSRALIRRGGLRFVERVSVAGHVLTILDEKNRVVRGCTVLVNGTEYSDAPATTSGASKLSGEIVIPFSSSPSSHCRIVIQKGDCACLGYLNHQSEQYSLSAGFVVDREQLLKGSTAQLLVRASLYLNGQPAPLSILEDVTLYVDSRDKEGITNSKIAKNFTLYDNREAVYNLRVPDDLRSLSVRLEAKVTQESSGSGAKKLLTASWTCALNQSEDSDVRLPPKGLNVALNADGTREIRLAPQQPHLRVREDGSFEILLLGRTGEPVPFVSVHLTLTHALLSDPMHVWCSTNDKGVISLGRLRNIKRISIDVGNVFWDLSQFTSRRTLIELPSVLHGKAASRADQIALVAPYVGDDSVPPPSDSQRPAPPVTMKAPSRFDVVLYALAADGSYLEDASWSLRHDSVRGLVHLVGLPAGDYELYYPRYDHRCRVRVAQTLAVAAEPAGAEDSSPTPTSQQFVLGRSRLLEIQEIVPVIAVAVQLTDQKDVPKSAIEAWERNAASVRTADEDAVRAAQPKDSLWLLVQLSATGPNTRVHVVCSEMLPMFASYDALKAQLLPQPASMQLHTAVSSYLDGRILGDEYRYVLERKHAPRRIGNMNRQPTLLLNPWRLQETITDINKLQRGADYLRNCMDACAKACCAAPQEMRLADDYVAPEAPTKFSLDFLGEPSTVLANLRPSAQSLCVAIPRSALGAGGLVQVFVVDALNVHSRWLPVPRLLPPKLLAGSQAESRQLFGALPYRDLRLHASAALGPADHFVERRAAEWRAAESPVIVSDITSNTVGLYESLAKVHSLFTALGSSTHLQSFTFLTRWGLMSDEEKAKLFSQYACHELHWFIYRKDEPFFLRVVKPFIAQKLEKQLVDWYLLSAVDCPTDASHPYVLALRRYLEPGRMTALNVFERILLYHRLKRCNVWPYAADSDGSIVQHVQDLLEREASSVVAADDPLLFKNALSCGALDPDAVKAAMALSKDSASAPPPLPPPEPEIMDLPVMVDHEGSSLDDLDALMSDLAPRTSAKEIKPPSNRAAAVTDGKPALSLDRAQGELQLAKTKQLSADLARRGKIQQTFKQLDQTQEWTESQYYQVLPANLQTANGTIAEQRQCRISAFWLAVAERVEAQPAFLELKSIAAAAGADAPFLSPAFVVQGRGTFTDHVVALSLLDLPFAAPQLKMQFAPSRVTITSPQPLIAFYRDLSAALLSGADTVSHMQTQLQEKYQLKVEQMFYDPEFRKQINYDKNNEELEYWVSKEFAQNKVYGCVVRVTSLRPAGSPAQKLDIMTQIPVGALPVGPAAFYTKSQPMQLTSGANNKVEIDFQFYFPAVGRYSFYPAHVSVDNALAGFAAPDAAVMNVVAKLTPPPFVPQPPVDKTTWEYISQCGSDDELFEYLRRAGPHKCNLDLVQFRCRKSVEFYRRLAEQLRKRQFIHRNSAAWAFAWYDPVGIAEFLAQTQLVSAANGVAFLRRIAPPFSSSLLKRDSATRVVANAASSTTAVAPSSVGVETDPTSADHLFMHLEYSPLVNARAHTLGQIRRILNEKFAQQYTSFLNYVARRAQLRATDLMAASYYMLLQDRIDEALRLFARIALLPDKPATVSRNLIASATAAPPIDKNGVPRQPPSNPADARRNLDAEFAAAPRDAPIGPQAAVDSPRYFSTQIQYDYLAAFFDFYDAKNYNAKSALVGVPQLATKMCSKYRDYPVPHWASRFADMADQLKELQSFSTAAAFADVPPSSGTTITSAVSVAAIGAAAKSDLQRETNKDNNAPDPERMRVLLAKMWQRTRPSFDIVLNGKQLSLDYANVTLVKLRYYVMDLELLFSTQPFFLSQHLAGGANSGGTQGNSLFVKPNLTQEQQLPLPAEAVLVAAAQSGAAAPMQTHVVDLPASLQDQNLIIEAVVPGGIRKTVTYFANSLLLSLQPQVGQLQVLERPPIAGAPSRPIAGAYVKVYAKLRSGAESFWKDLYTDLRGRADYCSLSDAASNLADVRSFSVLVVSDQFGSVIREVAPPGL